MARVFSYFGFILVAALFFVPFWAMRDEQVNNGHVISRTALTWHGSDLVIGGDGRLHVEELSWDSHGHEYLKDESDSPVYKEFGLDKIGVSSQPAFVVAALLVLAGAGVAMVVSGRWWTVGSAGAAFAAAGALEIGHGLMAYSFTHRYRIPRTDLQPAYGLWLALAVLVALGVANTVMAVRAFRARTAITTA
jgi:hypothetical protein